MNTFQLKIARQFLAKRTDQELLEMLQEAAPLLSEQRLELAMNALANEQQGRAHRRAITPTSTGGTWL